MSNYPLVSIALCTYNGGKYLADQLDSIVNQSYPNIEVIAVDDCSKDKTLAILNSYATKHPFIKVFSNRTNLGYIKNFEKAISLCNGRYIALSDQDDLWMKDKITLQIEAIGDHILIFHDSEFIDGNGTPLRKKMSDLTNMEKVESSKPFLFFNSVSGHTCLFARELLDYCLPFPKEIFHDRWLAFTALNVGKIKYLDNPLVKYRQHENSDTNILKLVRETNNHNSKGRLRIQKTITELELMHKYKFNKDREFTSRLLRLYRGRLSSYINIRLIMFLYGHSKSLLILSKKGPFSKINYIFKHIWGIKLKSY